MIRALRTILEKLFAIREGEMFRAVSMQFNIFLIITTLLVLKPTVNSLFLSTYGVESLPNAFILVAIFAGIITTLYSRILQRVRFKYLTIGTLVFSVLILVFFGVSLRTGFLGNWILYLFYIWVAIFALLTTSQFWLLANMVFNEREIKRLVGFIGAGAIAGGIFGGYLTSFLTQYLSSIDLPFVGAFFIAICIPVTVLIWHRTPSVQAVKKQRPTEKPKEHPFKIILKSKHLTLLACIVAVSNIVAKLVDYQFGGIASRLISDPEELTAFFGFWFSTFNVVSLIIQLMITRFVVSRYGIGISLFVLPIAICLSVLLLLVAPELLFAVILLKMADGSLKQSINKSAMELLILPINIETKNRTKPFIDVFIDSLATGISGMILIFVVKGLSLSTTTINVIILGFVMVWMYLVTNIRTEYLYSFKMKILNNIKSKDQSTTDIRKGAIVSGLHKVLSNGNPGQIISTLQQIRSLKDRKLNKAVCKLLTHPVSEVRAEALQHLYFYKNKETYQEVEKMTKDPSRKVKLAAFAYLIEHTPLRNKAIVDKHLDSKDIQLSGLALMSLAIEMQNNSKLRRKYNLKQRILTKLQAIPNLSSPKQLYLAKIYCIQAIGHANIPELYEHIKNFFEDSNTAVVRQALSSAGKTKSEYFVKDLIRFTSRPAFARTASKAILQYKEGLIDILEKFTAKQPDEIQMIRKYPAIVKHIGTQKSIRFLFKLLEHHDTIVRQEVLKGLSDLHFNYPKLQFRRKKVTIQVLEEVLRYQNILTMVHVQMNNLQKDESETAKARKRLVALLRNKLNACLENILRLLSLKYSRENISVIYKGLKSRKPGLRNTALEFLDNLLEPRLKKILIPLFDVGVIDIAYRRNFDNLNLEIPEEYTIFQALINNGRDIRIKIATLHLINISGDERCIPLVEQCIRFNDPELRVYAHGVLKAMNERISTLKAIRS